MPVFLFVVFTSRRFARYNHIVGRSLMSPFGRRRYKTGSGGISCYLETSLSKLQMIKLSVCLALAAALAAARRQS
ncbi:hypothetical protein O9992_12135 [Vibrio lentus]|nr:hypothetical protein [Vibrio lentus]